MKNSDDNSKKLENKIMSEIKSGRLKLRSKYVFMAEKLGLGSALVLSIILSILFFNLVLFYLQATDNLEYFSFGKKGILAFLESFPYLLVIGLILLLFLAGWLLAKTEWSYKKPFKYFALGLVSFVILAGGVMAGTDISELIENQIFNNRAPGMFLKPFIARGVEPRDRGIAGRIYETGDDFLILETPRGLEKIDLPALNRENSERQEQFRPGQFIIAIGKRENGSFAADEIHIKGEEMFPPMIKRGIHRQFAPFRDERQTTVPPLPPHLLNFDADAKDCLKQCFDKKINSKECFAECMK